MPICRLVLPFYAAALLFTAGCNGEGKKTDAPTLAPTASGLAASKSESKAATEWKVDEAGTASFTMKGHVETVIKGDTKKMRGQLEIDLADLTKTRGTIECDMTTLAMHTFDDEEKNEKQTVDAQTWLEVHDRIGDPAKVKANQWAVYAIRTITSAEPKDLSKGGATRTAKVTAKGELLLHGRKSEHSVDLEATFDRRLGRAGSHQRRIGAAAEQELDGLDDHRLACAGFARHRGHARFEQETHIGDHADVADGHLQQHRRSTGRSDRT